MSNKRNTKPRYNPKRGVQIDPELSKLWGKPLSQTSLKICEALGWAKLEETDAVRWRLTFDTEKFAGPIYRNGKPVDFICDIVLREFTVHRVLVALDPYLGKDGKRAELRILLTLVNLVMIGHAGHIDCEDGIVFWSLTDLPSALDRQAYEEDDVDEMMRVGNACYVLGERGEDLMIATPKGAWCGITDLQASQDDIEDVLTELALRELMCRVLCEDGVYRWQPTQKGISRGLDRRDIPAIDVLNNIGVTGFERKMAFGYCKRAEAPN